MAHIPCYTYVFNGLIVCGKDNVTGTHTNIKQHTHNTPILLACAEEFIY